MSTGIKMDFDPKTQRFILHCPFYLSDVPRGLPSRRFDPKSKTWRAPLVKQNVLALLDLVRSAQITEVTSMATQALQDFEKLTAGPVYAPIPRFHFEGAKFSPLEHQWSMLDHGWNLNAYALFAAMGTGKTFVSINMMMARWRFDGLRRAVIVCPATLFRTWEKEFEKYVSHKQFTTRRHATGDTQLKNWAETDPDKLHVLLVSVEGLGISLKMFEKLFEFIRPGHENQTMILVDESSRIKNPDAKRTERVVALGPYARWRMILNGTPIAKGIQDLWAQYEFLDPNIIGSGDYWAFKTRYVEMGGYENKQIVGYANVEELMSLIRPYTLEVNKSVLNLPSKLYKKVAIQASKEQQRLFDQIMVGLSKDGADFIKVENTLERTLRLQQVIGGFRPISNIETNETHTVPLDDNPKLDALLGLVDDHRASSKFIIWCRYVPEIERVVAELRQKYGPGSVVTYYGATSSEERGVAEDRYRNDPECRFFVGNPAAAGLGLTLISGEDDVMVYYSGTFAYIDRAQSEDRAHRIGQRRTVAVVDLVMEGTLDETIQAAIAAKTDLDVYVKEQMNHGKKFSELMRGQ